MQNTNNTCNKTVSEDRLIFMKFTTVIITIMVQDIDRYYKSHTTMDFSGMDKSEESLDYWVPVILPEKANTYPTFFLYLPETGTSSNREVNQASSKLVWWQTPTPRMNRSVAHPPRNLLEP